MKLDIETIEDMAIAVVIIVMILLIALFSGNSSNFVYIAF